MNTSRKSILFLGDGLILVASFFIMVIIRSRFVLNQDLISDLLIPFLAIGIICITALYALDLYDPRFIRPTSENWWRVAVVLAVSPIIAITLFYTFNFFAVTPKLTLVLFFISFGILFILWRRLIFKFFSQSLKNKTVIWGTSPLAQELFIDMQKNPHRGYEPLAHAATLQELSQVLLTQRFTILIIENHLQIPPHLIELISAHTITVIPLDRAYEEILQKISLTSLDETLFIQSVQNQHTISKKFHRIFECAVAIFILFITSPFLILMIIGIKIEDGGSILYKGNTRLGFLGKEFMLYKFRSMTEEKKRKTGQGADWTEKNDARITKVGGIIRKLHIDELAQMINILRGEISLVGPRPDVTPVGLELKKNVPAYYLRHIVKPGFTGWAQIKYHAPASHEEFIERFQYDLYYIKHREFFFDFGIMLRTLQIIFSHSV